MHGLPLVLAAYLVAGSVAASVSIISWRRRDASFAAVGLALATAGAAWWAWGDALLLLLLMVAPPSTDGVLVGVVLVGSSLLIVGFLLFARGLADPHWRPRRRLLALLAVHPLVTLVIGAGDPWWHLVVATTGRRTGIGVEWTPGPYFLVCAIYGFTLGGWGMVVLARAARHTSTLHRRQLHYALAAGAVPPLAILVTQVLLSAGVGVPDLAGVSFAVTGLIDWYALSRLGLLDLVPVARGVVLDRLTDAVVVLDPDGRIVDLNVAGRALIRRLAPHLSENAIGVPSRLVTAALDLPDPVVDGEYPLQLAGQDVVLDVQLREVHDPQGRHRAQIMIVRDITELHRRRAELAGANDRLRRQLATIEELRDALAEQAVRDELTGLYNRRHLMTVLHQELRRAQETDTALCVVLLDLDHFKWVNDTYGHDVGDDLLGAVADELSSGLRPNAVVARYGGEEFVVLLPGTGHDEAIAIAQEWRRRCERLAVFTARGPVRTTVSAGVAARGPRTNSAQTLLKAADEALYAAKAAGRNRVMLA